MSVKEIVDGEEVKATEKLQKSKPVVAKRDPRVSPFETRHDLNDGIRERKGFHTTWKREDEVDQAKEWGFTNVRLPSKNQEGNYLAELPGKETGAVLKRLELNMKDTWEYAMECPQKLFDEHIAAVTLRSKDQFNAMGVQMRETIEQANSSYGKRGGGATIDEDSGFVEQVEEPVYIPQR